LFLTFSGFAAADALSGAAQSCAPTTKPALLTTSKPALLRLF
jgi:hypothetical protein